MFNSRELATGIWLGVVFASKLSKADMRKSLVRVCENLFQPKILVLIICMLLYTAGMIQILFIVGLWNRVFLKDTLLWFVLTGVAFAINVATPDTPDRVFLAVVRDSVKVVVIIEFLFNTYTFSLLTELILVPVFTLIAMLDVYARTDNKYGDVSKLTSRIQAVSGLVVFAIVLIKAVSDYTSILGINTLKNLLLEPMLTILFIPFAYAFALYSNYESIFLRLEMGAKRDRSLIRYAKRKILWYSRLRLSRVIRLTLTFTSIAICKPIPPNNLLKLYHFS